MSDIEVVSLNYYPIKACAVVEAEEVTFSEYGIQYDREWVIDDGRGRTLTQRVVPGLALVQTSLETDQLVIEAPGMDGAVAVPLEPNSDGRLVDINLWKKPGTARDVGPDAAEYLSTYLGRAARLLRVEDPRYIKPECRVEGATDRTAFADGFPLLLGSMASLAALNEHLAEPITIDRFRPNIVVAGAPEYDEDYWRKVRIGDLRVFIVRACARCPVPNVDQSVGVLPKERVVSDALKATRRGIDPLSGLEEVFFGQNMTFVFEPGVVVRRRDTVAVETRETVRNFGLVA